MRTKGDNPMRVLIRIIAATPVLALLVAMTLPAAAQEQAADAATVNQVQAPLHEPRWLPWLGCWELVADAVDSRQVESTGRRVVCVTPRLDGRGVNLSTQIDSTVVADNTVIADGSQRALPEADCSGHQTASWSADGKRLHSNVSASCGDGAARSVIGLSMLIEGNRWVEIQSVSLDQGEHRELVVRQYDRLDASATQELGVATLGPALSARAAEARAAAAAPLDVDDILEASETFPVEVVEAAILESGSMFALDTNALLRLDDAGIETRVIDLMVAVSFPEQFIVDTGASYGGGGYGGYGYTGYSGYIGYYGYPNCWGHYYSPFYGPYGPGCGSFWYSGYYGGYRPPYYGGGGGYYRPSVPPTGSLYGGKVIKGRGYSVNGRPANLPSSTSSSAFSPGSVSISSRSSSAGSGDSGGLGYTVRRAIRRDGGGAKIGGAGRRSGGSVTRSGGFRAPGSAGGGASSAGSSSSSSGGTAKAKAKPRGGGSGGGGGQR
jgi:hypothetical protein